MFLQDNLYDVHKKVYRLLPAHSERILDIGCQEARVTRFYLKKSNCVVGVDCQKDFLLRAKQLNPGLKIVGSFAESLPFIDCVFDYVILTEMLGCISNQSQCIREIYRIMKPGGKLIITVPYKGLFGFLDPDNFKFYFPHIYYRTFLLLKKKAPSKSVRFSKQDDYYPHYNFREIKSLLNSKFDICEIHRGGFLIYPLSIWINYFFNSFHLKNTWFLKLVNYLSDIEYRINFGGLAYNLLVVATKV